MLNPKILPGCPIYYKKRQKPIEALSSETFFKVTDLSSFQKSEKKISAEVQRDSFFG